MTIEIHKGYTYNTESRQITFTEVECSRCKGTGEIEQGISCPLYWKPVKKYPNHKCPHCGAKNKDSHGLIGNEIVKCDKCHGTGKFTAGMYDSLDFQPVMKYIEVKILNGVHVASFNESYLGIGIIAGVTDYGDYMDKSKGDMAIIMQIVRDDMESYFHSHTQAGNLLTVDGKLIECGYLKLNQSGYSVFSQGAYFQRNRS